MCIVGGLAGIGGGWYYWYSRHKPMMLISPLCPYCHEPHCGLATGFMINTFFLPQWLKLLCQRLWNSAEKVRSRTAVFSTPPSFSSGFWISWEMVSTSSQRGIGDTVILESAAKNTAAPPKLTLLYEAPMSLRGSHRLHTRSWLFCPLRRHTGCKTRFYPLIPSWAQSWLPRSLSAFHPLRGFHRSASVFSSI